MIRYASLIALFACFCVGCSKEQSAEAPQNTVDLVVVNAKVWTGNAGAPWAEAIAIKNDKIVAVGTSQDLQSAGKPARTIDAKGRLVVPGFIDSHLHFVDAGRQISSVQLRDARTRDEFGARIKAFADTLPPNVWITGGSWDNSLWGGELPTRQWIDEVTGDRPVWLSRVDGHMALANTAALKLAGVTRNTAAIPGGEIVVDNKGEPTGALKDNAMSLIDKVVPPPSAEIQDRALAAAMKYVNEQGVTSVQNMGTWEDLAVFERASKNAKLTTRIYAVVPLADWARLRDEMKGGAHQNTEWLRVGGLKGFVDGSLGSHTAAMFEPFADTPNNRGLFVTEPGPLYDWVSGADKAGLQVMVHAIGDRANSTLLDTYERVANENGPRDRRFRIEHAQHLAPKDIPRFAQLDVIASMQPYHAIDDGRWAELYIGNRIATTYAFRDLLDSNARLAFGSDWFVAPATPLEGIYGAVTRRTLDDKNPEGWVPKQKITVEEAVRAYTSGAAYASFEEKSKGSIAPGLLADIVMLEQDIFTIPAEQIRDVKIAMTVVGGKVVYERTPTP
ncbi:MAG TPA: amidohydrolase [Steroidobacteraceae bacterium]|nr:amidohydrolase [Steroidobacteraceae bacterium]